MAGPITISIIGDNRGLNSSLDSSESRLKRIGGVAGKMGKAIGAGFLVAGAGAVAWGVQSVKSLARIEQINARTSNVIKSTGGAAGVTAKHVEKLAGRLENMTASEAEATQEGANLLLTFTNIKNGVGKSNQIFDRSTKTIVDMSRALGQDTKSSAIQLGKALNDPIKGVTALSRVGVSFTEQQKAQIKTLTESGRTMGAQKLILGELQKEFGGAGKAFAQTTQGQVELAKHAFGTLGETIFAGVLPIVGKVATAAAGLLNDLASGSGKAGAAFATISGAVQPVVATIISSLGQLRPVLQTAWTSLQQLLPTVQQVAGVLAGVLRPTISTVVSVFQQVAPVVMRTFQSVATSLMPSLKQLAATFKAQVLPALKQVVPPVVKFIGTVVQLAAKILGVVLPPLIRLAGFIISRVVPAVVSIVGGATKAIGGLIKFGSAIGTAAGKVTAFAGKVGDGIGKAIGFVTGLKDKVVGAVSGAGTWLLDAGKNIVTGLMDGIKSMGSWLISTITSWVKDKIPWPVRKALGISSPSKVMSKIARHIPEGIADGMRKTAKQPLTEAEKQAKALAKKYRELRSTVVSGALELGNVAGVGGDTPTADSIAQGLLQRVEQIKTFSANLRELKQAGLNKTALRQLAQAGVDQGGAIAQALAAGTADQLAQINSLQRQLAKSATGLGKAAADAVYSGKRRKRGQVSRDAVERAGGNVVRLKLSAEQLSRLQRGKEIRADLDAYESQGGRKGAA